MRSSLNGLLPKPLTLLRKRNPYQNIKITNKKMVLTSKQRDELNQAILQYLIDSQYNNAVEPFKTDSQIVDLNPSLEKDLLEKKWTSIVRLSKKVMALEQLNEQLTGELQAAQQSQSLFRKSNKIQNQIIKKDDSEEAPFIPKLKYTLNGHRAGINNVTFHPSYSMIASASDDGSIKLWDYEQGTFEKTLKGHTSNVNCVHFDPSGKYLASSSSDLTIKLWELKNFTCIKTLVGHEHSVSSVEFSQQGDFLISGSRDKTIKLWETSTGFCKRTLTGHDEWVRCVTYSNDEKQIASSSQDQTIIVWSIDNGQQINQLYGHEHVVEIVRYLNEGAIKIFTEKQGKQQQQVQSQQQNGGVHMHILVSGSRDKEIRIWNTVTAQCLATYTGHDNWVNGVTMHHDNLHLYSVGDDRTIRVWNMNQQKEVRKIVDAHEKFITKVLMCPKQMLMATCSTDQTIKIWSFH